MAVSDGSDRSDGTASSLTYEELFSVLMYYGHMSKHDILHSSRRFLTAIYQSYVKRACENLGVSPDSDGKDKKPGETQLTEDDYPTEFISFSQAQREKMIKESGISDTDFLANFKEFNPHTSVAAKRS